MGVRGSFPESVTLYTVQRYYSEQVAAALAEDPESTPEQHAESAMAATVAAFTEAHPEMETPEVVTTLGLATPTEDDKLEQMNLLDPLQEAV